MDDIAPIAISVFALFATLYQVHLQRVHDENSVKPLGQIDLLDRDGVLYIHVQNNGVGPLIVEKLTFVKDNQIYSRIQDCLALDPKSYDHIEITSTNNKVLIPGTFLDVFSKEFNGQEKETDIEVFRQQLSKLQLKVEGRDIYDNKVVIEKSFLWFARYSFILPELET